MRSSISCLVFLTSSINPTVDTGRYSGCANREVCTNSIASVVLLVHLFHVYAGGFVLLPVSPTCILLSSFRLVPRIVPRIVPGSCFFHTININITRKQNPFRLINILHLQQNRAAAVLPNQPNRKHALYQHLRISLQALHIPSAVEEPPFKSAS